MLFIGCAEPRNVSDEGAKEVSTCIAENGGPCSVGDYDGTYSYDTYRGNEGWVEVEPQ